MGLCCSDPNKAQLEDMLSNHILTLCLLTWNVNAKTPPATFAELLYHKNTASVDIYVIGLQEIVDLNAKNLIVDNDAMDANVVWETKIESILNPLPNSQNYNRRRKYKYVKVCSVHLVGISLMVYVKHYVWLQITDRMSSKCASGLFDIAGNKGAVAIRFNLFETSMCFVCAHLAAHKKNLKGRNTDYHKIIQKLTFVPGSSDDNTTCTNAIDIDDHELSSDAASSPRAGKKASDAGLSILQHDIVYFMGDINYRLEFNDLDEVYRLIRDENWTELLARDQLLHQIENGRAFADFHEEKIEFPPTFKYLVGTDHYEQTKKRTPSYCDRILWKIKKNNNVNNNTAAMEKEKVVSCIRYRCEMKEKMSDHKPVYGLFEVQC